MIDVDWRAWQSRRRPGWAWSTRTCAWPGSIPRSPRCWRWGRDFLKAGGVFTDDFIDAYIEVKMKEVSRYRAGTSIEFQMYYSL